MKSTYSTFDTFSVGDIETDTTQPNALGISPASAREALPNASSDNNDPSLARQEPKVIARLPRLSNNHPGLPDHPVSPSAETHLGQKAPSVEEPLTDTRQGTDSKAKSHRQQRLDRAASPLHRSGQRNANHETPDSADDHAISRDTEESSKQSALDRLAIFREGFRLDTLPKTEEEFSNPSSYQLDSLSSDSIDTDQGEKEFTDELEREPFGKPKLAIAPDTVVVDKRSSQVGLASETDHWSDNWLLRLEAAVMPYSKLIVFAAIITALGLTLLLLQAKPAARVGDAIPATPMADHKQNELELSSLEETQNAPLVEAVDETPIEITTIQPATSKGPNGLPCEKIEIKVTKVAEDAKVIENPNWPTPRAELAGNIMPVAPYRVANQDNRPSSPLESTTDERPDYYPQTANANSQWPTSSQGGTIR